MDLVSVERRNAIATLRYANPPHGTITVKGAAALDAALILLLADPAIRAIILAGGQSGIFIRHADVAQIARAADALQTGRAQPEDFLQGAFPTLCQRIATAHKPIIAAIDGICMGGGFEIALCCTARIASPAATAIGLPEIRIHIFPGAGGTQRLQHILGPHRARLFILQGTVLPADQAAALGLVDELAPHAETRAVALAESLAQRPPEAVAAILALMQAPPNPRLSEELTRFAELLRDTPAIKTRLEQFTTAGEQLDKL